jgi:dTDP-4-amino-4,6-dideoxygalactose transaminase
MGTLPVNDLSRDALALQAETRDALERVAASGWYLQGPERVAFEEEFSAYVGVEHCVGVANGTNAIELALLAVGCRPGDQVVTAANAGMYTTTAALHAGLTPVYADVDPQTHCVSAETIEAALTSATRAVVVTHLYGRIADPAPVVELCAANSLALIEDCAQAAGARFAGAQAGAFGAVGCFSFYPTKNLGALGDAGAVVTNDEAAAQRVRQLSQYGWESKYRVAMRGGTNSRIDELQAAALRVRLPHLDGWNARRRDIVSAYASALRPGAGRFVATEDESFVGHLAVFVTPERDQARERFTRAGISTEIHYPIPDHRQPVWDGAYADVSLPVTESVAEQVTTLPCFPALTDDEVARVCEVLGEL